MRFNQICVLSNAAAQGPDARLRITGDKAGEVALALGFSRADKGASEVTFPISIAKPVVDPAFTGWEITPFGDSECAAMVAPWPGTNEFHVFVMRSSYVGNALLTTLPPCDATWGRAPVNSAAAELTYMYAMTALGVDGYMESVHRNRPNQGGMSVIEIPMGAMMSGMPGLDEALRSAARAEQESSRPPHMGR